MRRGRRVVKVGFVLGTEDVCADDVPVVPANEHAALDIEQRV